jgi:hypothetical protein
MSKILIGIVAVTSGLALAISISASASSVEASGEIKQDFSAVDKGPLRLNTNSEITEVEMPSRNRLPLILPQPTKTEGQNTYGLG